MQIDITHALDKIGGTLIDYNGYEPAAPGNYASMVVLVERDGYNFHPFVVWLAVDSESDPAHFVSGHYFKNETDARKYMTKEERDFR
jgi:hypothetical protein